MGVFEAPGVLRAPPRARRAARDATRRERPQRGVQLRRSDALGRRAHRAAPELRAHDGRTLDVAGGGESREFDGSRRRVSGGFVRSRRGIVRSVGLEGVWFCAVARHASSPFSRTPTCGRQRLRRRPSSANARAAAGGAHANPTDPSRRRKYPRRPRWISARTKSRSKMKRREAARGFFCAKRSRIGALSESVGGFALHEAPDTPPGAPRGTASSSGACGRYGRSQRSRSEGGVRLTSPTPSAHVESLP